MKYKMTIHIVVALSLFIAGNTLASTITSFENGEVFDGRAGARDGVGDEQFLDISSYFNSLSQGASGYSGQAMSYFDITGINTNLITTATFSWDVNQSFHEGAPNSTSIYFMENDDGLSLDDFNKGSLLGTVNTSLFDSGDTISIDLTSMLQTYSSDFLGIRLASNDADNEEHFLTMENSNASITYSVVPEPISSTLFIVGGATLGFRQWRKRKTA